MTVEATGARRALPRPHNVKVSLVLSTPDPKFNLAENVAQTIRDVFPTQRPELSDTTVTKKGRAGSVTQTIVSIEGMVALTDRPDDKSIDLLRERLASQGYRVALREKRECSELRCPTEAFVEWNQGDERPAGWYDKDVCGKHNYRTCVGCKSVYVLTSTNFVGQAPSVYCVVCGGILVEWGSSKAWSAELVSRGTPRPT